MPAIRGMQRRNKAADFLNVKERALADAVSPRAGHEKEKRVTEVWAALFRRSRELDSVEP